MANLCPRTFEEKKHKLEDLPLGLFGGLGQTSLPQSCLNSLPPTVQHNGPYFPSILLSFMQVSSGAPAGLS